MTRSANYQDVEAIMHRVAWALSLSVDEWRTYINAHPMDALHTIPHPKNNGALMIGQVGTDRFGLIADRYLKANAARKARANRAALVEKLRCSFTPLFLQECQRVDDGNIGNWIAEAYRAAEADYAELTHFIPCALFFGEKVKRFSLGPVTFLHASEFFTSHQLEFDKLRLKFGGRHRRRVMEAVKKGFPEKDAATPEQSQQWGDHLAGGVLDSFRSYTWFAKVTVPACEAETSYDRALFATRGALNFIKVLLGSRYTYRLRTAEDPSLPIKSATLSQGTDGEFRVSISTTPLDNDVGDEWAEALTEGTGGFYAAAGRVLDHAFGFSCPPHLCARFTDALHWYGDAIAERSQPAKIVKFVNAIERICGTGKEPGVTELVITRAAIIYARAAQKTFAEAEAEVDAIYDCRSKLVHGSLSPFDDTVRRQVVKTHDITRLVLLGGLDRFHALGLEDSKFSERDLRRYYQELAVQETLPPKPATDT